MDLNVIKQLQRDQLAHLLESEPGKKDFVIDPCFTKLLDRIAGVAFLKDHGVDKIYKLEPAQNLSAGNDVRIYFVRPTISTMRNISNHINSEKQSNSRRNYKIVMVPRRLHVCEKVLEAEGVYGSITIEDFNLELVTLDTDLLSLELPDFLRSFYLEGDQTWIHTIASSIVHLENLFGCIPNVYCLGRGARMTFDLMNILSEHSREDAVEKGDNVNIGHLFIVDREIDFVTPLCTPVTYEALLDELFGIDCGIIDITDPANNTTGGKMLLTSENQIFQSIRNRHFSNVFDFISGKAKELKTVHNKKDDLKSVKDVRQFVSNDLRDLKQQQKTLAQHIGACESIMKSKTKANFEEHTHIEHSIVQGIDTRECINYIEECLYKQINWLSVLRLICLLSLTENGIQSKDYKALRKQFLHSHGFDMLTSFFNLKKLGILTEQELPQSAKSLGKMAGITRRSSQFKLLSKKLNLCPKTPDSVDLRVPNDMSYVFNGAYTPLACKLVDLILTRDSLVSLEEVFKTLPGGVKCDQHLKPTSKARGGFNIPSTPAAKIVMVYFLGGCTFSEIAALRYLAKTEGFQITIATTAIVTGNSFLDSVMERKPI